MCNLKRGRSLFIAFMPDDKQLASLQVEIMIKVRGFNLSVYNVWLVWHGTNDHLESSIC